MNQVSNNLKMLLTPRYYKEQMSNWQLPSYLLLAFGWGVLIMNYVSLGDYGIMNSLATAGGLMGFTCVNAIAQNKPLNGILGFVSAILIIINAIHATAYNDVLMQLSYIVVLDIPIMLYGRDWQNKTIHASKGKELAIIFAFFIAITAVLYYSDTHWLISKSPLIDSIAAGVGLTGSLSMMLKSKVQTFFWLGQGIMSIALWTDLFFKGATTPTLLVVYTLYLMNNIITLTVSPWALNVFKKGNK